MASDAGIGSQGGLDRQAFEINSRVAPCCDVGCRLLSVAAESVVRTRSIAIGR